MASNSVPRSSRRGIDPRLPRALAYYASYVTLGLVIAAFGPTLQGLAGQTGSLLSQVSIIFTANSLGYIGGSLLGGWLYDRFPGQPVLAVTMFSIAALAFLTPLMPALWLLVLVMVAMGAAMGVLDVGGNTLIIWLFGDDVGPYMNALHFSFGLGAFLSPLLIDRMVILTGGIRWAYWLLAILMVPVIFWMTRIPSPERPQAETGRAVQVQPARFGLLTWMIAFLMFLHVGAELSFGGWIFSYGTAMEIGTETTARLLNSTYWGALTLGRLLAIPIAMRLLPRTMLLIDLVGASLSMLVMVLFPGWQPAVWIGTFGFGLCLASIFATVMNFTERRMPVTGRVTAIILVGANLGSMSLPWVIGNLFEPVGPQSMTFIVGGAITLALVLFVGIDLYARRFPIRGAVQVSAD